MYWHFLRQGIFPTQGLNLDPPHWQVGSLPLSHQGCPQMRGMESGTLPTEDRSFFSKQNILLICKLRPTITLLFVQIRLTHIHTEPAHKYLWSFIHNCHELKGKQDILQESNNQQYIHMMKLLFSCSVVSDSLWPHGLQHTRLPCPSPSPPQSSPSIFGRWIVLLLSHQGRNKAMKTYQESSKVYC